MYSFHTTPRGIQIPTLPALIILAVFIVVTAVALRGGESRRSDDGFLLNVKRFEIGNITHNQATVFWRTEEPISGFVYYGEDPKETRIAIGDIRDSEKVRESRHNHIVELANLKTNTTYYLHLGDKTGYGGATASFTTTQPLSQAIDMHPVYGSVITASSRPEYDAIIVFSIPESYPLITYTKGDGSFLTSLCCVVRKETNSFIRSISKSTQGRIEVIAEDGGSIIYTDKIETFTPLSIPLVMGVTDQNSLIARSNKDNPAVVEGGVVLGEREKLNEFDVIYPAQGAIIPGSQPLFKGVGIAGKNVTILIKPLEKEYKINVGQNGVWSMTPPLTFAPGTYTATFSSLNSGGVLKKISRIFNITKSGESVLGDATPEATLAPTVFVPSPTEVVISDIAPTEEPTPTPAIPPAGIDISSLSIIALTVVLIGAGLVLIF